MSNSSLLFHFLTEVKYSAREVLVVPSTLSFKDCLYSRITHMIFRTDASILTDGIFRYVGNAYFISSWDVCSPPFISSFPLATVRSLVFPTSPIHVRDNADLHVGYLC